MCGDHYSRRGPRADRRPRRESYEHCRARHLLAHRHARRHAHFFRRDPRGIRLSKVWVLLELNLFIATQFLKHKLSIYSFYLIIIAQEIPGVKVFRFEGAVLFASFDYLTVRQQINWKYRSWPSRSPQAAETRTQTCRGKPREDTLFKSENQFRACSSGGCSPGPPSASNPLQKVTRLFQKVTIYRWCRWNVTRESISTSSCSFCKFNCGHDISFWSLIRGQMMFWTPSIWYLLAWDIPRGERFKLSASAYWKLHVCRKA